MGTIAINTYLRNVLYAGVIWDTMGGIIFLFVHGIFQVQLTPDIHPFYAIVTGLFLFFLAHIQYISAADIKAGLKNIGSVILFRVFYGISVILFSLFNQILPKEFFVIALVDIILVVLLMFFATVRGNIKVKELF